MKKIFSCVITLFLVLLFTGCTYSINTYKVSFNLNGGTGTIEDVMVEEGNLISLPEGANHVFNDDLKLNGWSINPEGTSKWDINRNKVYSDMTLYAIWGEHETDLSGYMDTTKSWSKEDHLYIHYKRNEDTESDYDEWNLWIWAFAPKRYEGIESNWFMYDKSGAVGEIDMTKAYANAGTGIGLYADFFDVETVGFLIVFIESKSKSEGMWQSDGGNTYVSGIQTYLAENGSVHIFCVQNVVGEFTVNTPNQVVEEDPYENLSIADGESKHEIDSSRDNSALRRKTSDEFYGAGYQIQVSSFADSDNDGFGDLNGIYNNLDYLEDLGVKVLWLTPVQLANNYHGYDIIDFYKIDPRFGTMEDYKRLIDEAHSRGMKILMDFVINHTANNADWFKKSCLFKTEKVDYDVNDDGTVDDKDVLNYRDFYTWSHKSNLSSRSNGRVTEDGVFVGGGSGNDTAIWFQYATYGYYYFGSFSSSMPELNYDYQGVRNAIVEVGKFYLEMGIDGFRLDAVKHIYSSQESVRTNKSNDEYSGEGKYEANVTKNINFFNEFCAKLKDYKPDCFIVGENFDGNNDNIAPYVKSIDSQFSFPALYTISNTFDTENPTSRSISYQEGYYKFDANRTDGVGGIFIDSPFTSNHDVIRAINFVSGNAENEVGGKNISALNRDYYESRAKLWGSIIMTLPGLSWMFYGDELGMASNLYPNEYGNQYSYLDRWYRQPMKWEYSRNSETCHFYVEAWMVEWQVYNQTLLGVKEQLQKTDSMLNHFKAVINLKNTIPEILKGDINLWVDDEHSRPGLLIYERRLANTSVLVYHNMTNQPINNFQSGSGSENYRGNTLFSQGGSDANYIGAYQTVIIRLR